MSNIELIILLILFFITTAVGVVTGSNSLITVPVMFQFGIDPKVAIATNMFGLFFMSVGATIPFLKKDLLDKQQLKPLVFLTLFGSAIGAFLVGLINADSIPLIVSVSMIVIVLFTVLKRDAGVVKAESVSQFSRRTAYLLTFFLGIYGGLYSGGYVTVMTVVFVGLLGMTFAEAVAGTKLVNVFSSLIATIIFMWQGLVDYRLGAALAVVMFAAAYVGAKTVTKLNDLWLKRIFLATVMILAVKTIFDFI